MQPLGQVVAREAAHRDAHDALRARAPARSGATGPPRAQLRGRQARVLDLGLDDARRAAPPRSAPRSRSSAARRLRARAPRPARRSSRGLASCASARCLRRVQPRAPRVQLGALDRQRRLAPRAAARPPRASSASRSCDCASKARAGRQRLLARGQLGGAQDLRLLGRGAASAIARVTLRTPLDQASACRRAIEAAQPAPPAASDDERTASAPTTPATETRALPSRPSPSALADDQPEVLAQREVLLGDRPLDEVADLVLRLDDADRHRLGSAPGAPPRPGRCTPGSRRASPSDRPRSTTCAGPPRPWCPGSAARPRSAAPASAAASAGAAARGTAPPAAPGRPSPRTSAATSFSAARNTTLSSATVGTTVGQRTK